MRTLQRSVKCGSGRRAGIAVSSVSLLEQVWAEELFLTENCGVALMVQFEETIEDLLSPHDRERGRRAVDALIDAAFAIEDETGHLRRIS